MTPINKALDKGISKEDFKSNVICKKCGKDIEFLKTVELHLKCPRCKTPLERDLAKENKHGKKVINYDFFRRNKKYFLYVGLISTALALVYNIGGFFLQLFAQHGFWYALISAPFVLISLTFTSITRLKSKSKKHRILEWTLLILNIIAIVAIIITVIPPLNDKLLEWYQI